MKYGPNGQRSWVGSTSPHIGNDGEHRFNSAGTNNDRAADISGGKIAVLGGGIGAGHSVVFITGTAPATALGRSDDDYATLAIRGNDGYRMWSGDSDGVVYFDGGQQPTPLNDQAVAMAAVYSSVDPAIPTTVVVTGNSAVPPSEAFDMMEPGGPAPGQCNDIVTVAYDTTVGLPAWNQPHRYDDLGSCDAAASVVTAYEASNIDYVWITGTSEGDIVAIKLDRSTGIQSATWPATATEPAGVRRYDGGGADTAVDIVASDPLNGGGNIYVAGSSVRLGSLDYATIHWDKDGIMPMGWPKFDAGPAGGADVPEDLVIGKYDVFVTGTSAGVGAQNDLLTQRH